MTKGVHVDEAPPVFDARSMPPRTAFDAVEDMKTMMARVETIYEVALEVRELIAGLKASPIGKMPGMPKFPQ